MGASDSGRLISDMCLHAECEWLLSNCIVDKSYSLLGDGFMGMSLGGSLDYLNSSKKTHLLWAKLFPRQRILEGMRVENVS